MSATIYIRSEGIPLLPAGEWAWVVQEEGGEPIWLVFGCPCGDRMCNGLISVDRDGDNPPTWKWDGDWDAPTLTPSIQRRGGLGCDWHGYLTAGEFVPC